MQCEIVVELVGHETKGDTCAELACFVEKSGPTLMLVCALELQDTSKSHAGSFKPVSSQQKAYTALIEDFWTSTFMPQELSKFSFLDS